MFAPLLEFLSRNDTLVLLRDGRDGGLVLETQDRAVARSVLCDHWCEVRREYVLWEDPRHDFARAVPEAAVFGVQEDEEAGGLAVEG